jgi:hypothetical protein
MKPVRTQQVEIAGGHFRIDIYMDPSGTYRSMYYGTGLAKVQPLGGSIPLMEDIPGGRVPNCANADEAFRKACKEIEDQYGKIVQVHPAQGGLGLRSYGR